MTIIIRKADKNDCPQILEFIKGLAEYEQLSNEVMADEEKLRQTLFSDDAVAFVLIAELNGVPAGFALYFYNYSTFLAKPGIYLEDLFVEPKFRGQKVGKSLLVKLAQIAVEENLGRFEWSVLDWNEPAINFYRAMGAIGMDGWTVQRVSGGALKQLASKSI